MTAVCLQLPTLLKDDRFADMFKDSAFQVDTEAEEYKLLNPLVTKLEKNRKKKDLQQEALDSQFDEVQVGWVTFKFPVNARDAWIVEVAEYWILNIQEKHWLNSGAKSKYR